MKRRLVQFLQALIERLSEPEAAGDQPPKSAAHAEALVRTAARLNRHVEQKALLKAICQEATNVLDVPVAAIALFDSEQEQFKLAAGEGLPDSFAQQVPPIPLEWLRQNAGQAVQPVVVHDLQDVEQDPLSRLLTEHLFRTVIFLELHYRERLLGILFLGTLGTPSRFAAEELSLLSGLGDQAAQAITNARLFKALHHLLQRTQRQSRRLQRIMDAVPDGLVLLGEKQELLLANAAGRQMLDHLAPGFQNKVPLHRLGDHTVRELLAESDAGAQWLEVRSAPPDAGDEETEIRTFEVATRSIEDSSGAPQYIAVLRDVTEERQRRQVAQSQDRLATVGQLAAGIAHDFNNIMAVITLYSQTLERNPDFPRRGEYLATMSEQARHASDLIVQILDFSRRNVMEHSRLDLLPFVKETVKLLRRTLPENITVNLEAEPGEYDVSADPTHLQQALMNLALNARDAMPEGGELQVALTDIMLRAGEASHMPSISSGRYICLSVADNGQGIPPENLRRLFEPYFTTKEPGVGTGMGLSQVYGIVKQHGGDIEVDSRPGQGARFTIYLPALEPAPPEPDYHTQPAVDAGSVTVLLVEDHEPTREAIADTLEILGYNVLVATTGREALNVFKNENQSIDVILSDLVMPEMGGVQLYRNLSQRDPDLKMIVMTGYPLEKEGRDLLEQGIVQWIRKPFSPEALSEKLNRALADA